MNTKILEKQLEELLTTSLRNITVAKTIHIHYHFSSLYKDYLMRQAIVSIYSCWEEFIKQSLSEYLRSLNLLQLNYQQLHPNYMAHQLDSVFNFKNPKTNFDKIVKKSSNFIQKFEGVVVFNTAINTESNANLTVTNKILKRFRLKLLDEKKYKKGLDALLQIRNSIAHGNYRISIEQSHIDDFSLLIQNLMDELGLRIIEASNKQVYLKQTLINA